MQVMYDLKTQMLNVYVRNDLKKYMAKIPFKLQLFMWYTLIVSWEKNDGLRVYINNKQVNHVSGISYVPKNIPRSQEIDINNFPFTIGKDMSIGNYLDNFSNNEGRFFSKEETKNNHYEFIVHRIVQYDARKYPDEIIAKNSVFQVEKRSLHTPIKVTWLWYTVGAAFIFMFTAILIVFGLLLKHRSKNGFWSRENDLKTNQSSKSFKCFSIFNQDLNTDFNDQNQQNLNLELKRCNLKEDRYLGPVSIDEYLTNSLYGTINRLISNQNTTQNGSLSMSSCTEQISSSMCTRNFNHTDGTIHTSIHNSTSYILPNDDTSAEIHF